MHPHYIVVNDFTDSFGKTHAVGDLVVVGDATPPPVIDEIIVQLEAGNLREIPSGAGVARPSDREQGDA